MKQFYFTFKTDDRIINEVNIASTGMMDALKKAQSIKKELEIKHDCVITVKFLGVAYTEIA